MSGRNLDGGGDVVNRESAGAWVKPNGSVSAVRPARSATANVCRMCAGMQGMEHTQLVSNVAACCSRREKFGALTQSHPYTGSICRFSESNMTITIFLRGIFDPGDA